MLEPPAAARPRLGFLGLGWIGRQRLEAVVQAGTAEIVALADADAGALAAAQVLAPEAAQCPGLVQLLSHPLDGVVIATPSARHAGEVAAALRHGCAVFCQKPLGRHAAEVAALLDLAHARDRLLAVDLSYRHIVGLGQIRELIRAGALGEVYAVDLTFHNAYGPDKPWFYDRAQAGGGCVIDLGVHLVDAALWILGQPVARVESRLFAAGRALAPLDSDPVEDYAAAQLTLAGGAVVNLACSWRLHAGQPAEIAFRFYGTKGGAVLRNQNGSFYEFCAEHFVGTERRSLGPFETGWGGRALLAWVCDLTASRGFRAEIETQREVARVLDSITQPAQPTQVPRAKARRR